MKTSIHSHIAWLRLGVTLITIALVALVISITLPYEASGGSIPGKLELKEETLPPQTFKELKMLKPVQIRGEIAVLTVDVEKDHYFGQAQIRIQNPPEMANKTCIAIIPGARVQRIFELAMTREIDVVMWGYKTPAPAGSPLNSYPFYTVYKASVWDPKILVIGVPEEGI